MSRKAQERIDAYPLLCKSAGVHEGISYICGSRFRRLSSRAQKAAINGF
jgi:hypothetical protein